MGLLRLHFNQMNLPRVTANNELTQEGVKIVILTKRGTASAHSHHIYVQEYHEYNISNNAHCVLALVLVNFALHLDEFAEMERTVREISRMLKEQMSVSCKFNWLSGYKKSEW